MKRPLTEQRATEIIEAAKARATYGPWEDQIAKAATAEEYEALRDFCDRYGAGHSTTAGCLRTMARPPIRLVRGWSNNGNCTIYFRTAGRKNSLFAFLVWQGIMEPHTASQDGEADSPIALYAFDLEHLPAIDPEDDCSTAREWRDWIARHL